MDKREIISGIVTLAMFIDIVGLTGSAEQGYLDFGEYAVAAVIRLIIMGPHCYSGVISSPEKKENAPTLTAISERRIRKCLYFYYNSKESECQVWQILI